MIAIIGCETREDALAMAFSWQPGDGKAIGGMLTSGCAGVALTFGPTVAVAHWPAWLLSIAHFGEDGGVVQILLDPHPQDECGGPRFLALDMRGARAREAFAGFLHALEDGITTQGREPSDEELQAIGTCRGTALALTTRTDGPLPSSAGWPEIFQPASLPIVIDDHDAGPSRQHVRLTYRLPRVAGWLTAGCSLRLFLNERSFGIEFRALPGDHLPMAIRPACIEDGLGPVLRFTIDRGGAGTVFEGQAEAIQALKIVQAVARQVYRDMTAEAETAALTGFQGAGWRHWLAALPDLLALAAPMPLDTAEDY
jgi:hypothetical protein